ncbi:MAG: phage portal protein [Clostridia bacterium]|nr:phage portal protein [Clostridia bacterium]
MIQRDPSLLTAPLPSPELLRSVLREHARDCARLSRLAAYYRGEHDVLRRERRKGLPNSRIPHGYPAYISDMAAGYLIGTPVRYEYEPDKALAPLLEALRACDSPSVDAELAMQQSVFGRGVELYCADENARPRCVAVDPRDAFVVYSDDPFCRPLFGVYQHPEVDLRGNRCGLRVTVYTDKCVARYRCAQPSGLREPYQVDEHFFGGLPLVEYWNNADATGDFERVLPLIDAYDVLQSDRVNDRQQFADALLVLTGVMGLSAPEDGDSRTPGERLRQDKTLALPDSTARVEWLTKEAHEGDADILRAALQSDIHKFSMVPDLTDSQFAANASGVAMRYKLLGLEQLTRVKERFFCEGLRERMRRFGRYLALLGMPEIVPERVRFVFTRALPANDAEEAEIVRDLHGIVPDELLLPQLSFLRDLPTEGGEAHA